MFLKGPWLMKSGYFKTIMESNLDASLQSVMEDGRSLHTPLVRSLEEVDKILKVQEDGTKTYGCQIVIPTCVC